MVDFDSLNPYHNLASLSGETPDELIQAIKAIKTPIKIVSIVSHKNKFTAFVFGDVRQPKPKKGKA